jgi:hypothetical protein
VKTCDAKAKVSFTKLFPLRNEALDYLPELSHIQSFEHYIKKFFTNFAFMLLWFDQQLDIHVETEKTMKFKRFETDNAR